MFSIYQRPFACIPQARFSSSSNRITVSFDKSRLITTRGEINNGYILERITEVVKSDLRGHPLPQQLKIRPNNDSNQTRIYDRPSHYSNDDEWLIYYIYLSTANNESRRDFNHHHDVSDHQRGDSTSYHSYDLNCGGSGGDYDGSSCDGSSD